VKDSTAKKRYGYCLANLVEKLGADTSIKKLWVPQLRLYQTQRLADWAAPKSKKKTKEKVKKRIAPGTVNRELSTLSRLFGVLIELQLVDANPCRLVPRLSEKTGERQVYLSFADVQRIIGKCPEWFKPIVLTAYYTGMRRGEIFGLTRKQVNLSQRMITLSPQDTKEAHWKRIPLHKDLLPVLEEVLKVSVLGTDQVFLLRDEKGTRPLGFETFRNPWPRACEALDFPKPRPVFHDLRHTWRTNARRSKMHPEIEMAIMGHSQRGRSVHERYGRISDKELLDAIDAMTFDHGQTEIWASR